MANKFTLNYIIEKLEERELCKICANLYFCDSLEYGCEFDMDGACLRVLKDLLED